MHEPQIRRRMLVAAVFLTFGLAIVGHSTAAAASCMTSLAAEKSSAKPPIWLQSTMR